MKTRHAHDGRGSRTDTSKWAAAFKERTERAWPSRNHSPVRKAEDRLAPLRTSATTAPGTRRENGLPSSHLRELTERSGQSVAVLDQLARHIKRHRRKTRLFVDNSREFFSPDLHAFCDDDRRVVA